MMQGAQIWCSVTTWKWWDGEGGRAGEFKREGHMHTYGQFTLIYGGNQHNIVKQLSSRTRDQAHVPCTSRWILVHCTTREVPTVSSVC